MDQIFQNGERFRGYVVERLLGNGGLGAVYLVRHELMDRLYAMKILFPEVAEDNPEYVQRFVREARLAANINHPNLVSVFDVGYDDAKGVYYLIMEYADGSNLRTAIAMGGAMSADEAVRIIASIAKALSAGEPFGLVHRDIKPENIMLENDGTVKLVDLGVAKACNTDSLNTVPQTVFGTPNYISPEQACDSSNVDSRADVYSLGVMLFEMLTGRRPYDCDDPRKVLATLLSPAPLPDVRTVAASVPAPLAGVVAHMLAKAPEQRLSSASAVLKALSDAGYVAADSDTSRSTANVRREEADFSFSDFDGRDNGDAPTFETQDVEMQKFIEASKAKRRRKELVSQLALPLAALAVAIAVLVAAIAYRM